MVTPSIWEKWHEQTEFGKNCFVKSSQWEYVNLIALYELHKTNFFNVTFDIGYILKKTVDNRIITDA